MTRPAPPTDDVSGLLGALLDEAEELRNVRPELAYALAQRALTQVGEGARSHTAARALFLMGVAQYENKEPHSALRLLNTAAARAQTLGDDALACRALNATALVLTDLGDFGRAVQLHLTNLERTRARGDVPGQLRALVNLGGLHADAFERDLALRYAREAVALARETERPEYEVQAQHALGVVHTRSGQHRAALAVYERALLQVREHGLYAFEALVLGGLFGSLCALGRPGEVLARARQLQLKVSAELPVLAQFRLKLSLGRAHAECGDPAAAQPFCALRWNWPRRLTCRARPPTPTRRWQRPTGRRASWTRPCVTLKRRAPWTARSWTPPVSSARSCSRPSWPPSASAPAPANCRRCRWPCVTRRCTTR
ncbi:tetratricopeptide repeat protein [Deinococcus multiflagellatus]|uniref:Tetratricopeptide repeat protein n=1 Tax=Deinococcus multiflagellatus TaxID=1656887 RepID=A0ABW1ZLS4_9DEIO